MLRMSLIFTLFGLTAAAAPQAMAQDEATTKAKIEDTAPAQNAPQGQDVDTLITNQKLRTDTGSKSKISMATGFGYSGGALKQPFGETRPNITGATGSTDFPSLGGSISAKFAFTTQHSLFGGVGMRWVAPLEGSRTPTGYKGDRVDVDNPYLTYQYIYNFAGLQSAVQFKQTHFTTSDLVRKGFQESWGLSQSSVYEFKGTGLSLAFATWIGAAIYNNDNFKNEQSDYSWAFVPAIEYKLSDRLNLRLDSNVFIYEHIRATPGALTFRRQDVSQNLSLGVSVARDVYVAPSISFAVSRLALDRTTWGIGAGVNLF